MKRNLFSAAMCLTIFWLTGCVKEPEPYVITCADGIVPHELASKTGVRFFIKNDNERIDERGLVIRSEIEYRSYIRDLPEIIDFDRKTLLTGRFFSNYSTDIRRQEVVSDCSKKMIYYNITFMKVGNASAGRTYFHAVIPKISEDTKVKFNFTVDEQ